LLHPSPAPSLLTLEEAARRLGIGRTLLRRMIAAGELPDVRLGRRHLVPSPAVDRFIERFVTVAEAEPPLEPLGGPPGSDHGRK